jgi:hypothetical protein
VRRIADDPRRLDGGSVRHIFTGGGHSYRVAEYRRGDEPERLGSRAATHQDDAIDAGAVAFQGVKTVGQPAQ